MFNILKPAYSFIRHAIIQAASLLVYHFSGPYISLIMRWGYEKGYAMIYGTPTTWWSIENIFYYVPLRERWTNRGFQYGEQYGPIICATLAAWMVQGLVDLLILALMRRRHSRSHSSPASNHHHDMLQTALETLVAIRDRPASPLHLPALNNSESSKELVEPPCNEELKFLNQRLEGTIDQLQQLLAASNPSLNSKSSAILASHSVGSLNRSALNINSANDNFKKIKKKKCG